MLLPALALVLAVPHDTYAEAFLTAHEHLLANELDAARDGYERCLAAAPDNPILHVHLACVEARSGSADAALGHLERAVELGYDDAAVAAFEPDLASIRGDARFDALLQRMRAALDARLAAEPPPRPQLFWSPDLAQPTPSPDGELVATGRAGHGWLWNARWGDCVAVLTGHDRGIGSALFSGDGLLVASTDVEGTLRVWDGRSGSLQRELTPAHFWGRMSFSHDGFWLMGSDRGDPARIWHVPSGDLAAELPGRTDGIACLSPDGERALTDGGPRAGGRVVLWDARTGESIAAFRDFAGAAEVRGGFSGDGELAFVHGVGGARAKIVRADDGEHVGWVGELDSTIDAALLRGQPARLVTRDRNGRVRWWDPWTGEKVRELDSGHGRIAEWSLSSDGALLSTRGARMRRVWDARAGELLWEDEAPGEKTGSGTFLLSDDGSRAVSQATWGSETFVHEASTGEVIGGLRDRSLLVHDPHASAAGRLVAIPLLNGTTWVLDLDQGRPRFRVDGPAHPGVFTGRVVELSPDGRWLATAHDDGRARVWDADTGELAHELDAFRTGRYLSCSVSWSPKGRRLVTWHDGRPANLWDAATGARIATLGEGNVVAVDWSRSGSLLATAQRDPNEARAWNGFTGEPASSPLEHDARLVSVAISPDEDRIATGAADDYARVWELGSERVVGRYGHPDLLGGSMSVDVVRFGPEGERLVTTTTNWWTVNGWDVDSGRRDWQIDFSGGSPVTVGARFIGDSHLLHVDRKGVVDARDGSVVRPSGSAGACSSGDGSVRLIPHGSSASIERGDQLLVRFVPRRGGGWVLLASSGHLDASAGSLADVVARLEGETLPLDSLAAAMLDPKRVRASTAGVEPAPLRPSRPPAIAVADPPNRVEALDAGAASVRFVVEAKSPAGLLGFEVRQDGESIDAERVRRSTRLEAGGAAARLELELSVAPEATTTGVRVRAIARDGLLSRPVHVAWRRPG